MDNLDAYDFELDPPTMIEFQMFLKLGNLLDMIDHGENWIGVNVDAELSEAYQLLDEVGKKYDGMLMEYYEGQASSNPNDRQQDL